MGLNPGKAMRYFEVKGGGVEGMEAQNQLFRSEATWPLGSQLPSKSFDTSKYVQDGMDPSMAVTSTSSPPPLTTTKTRGQKHAEGRPVSFRNK